MFLVVLFCGYTQSVMTFRYSFNTELFVKWLSVGVFTLFSEKACVRTAFSYLSHSIKHQIP